MTDGGGHYPVGHRLSRPCYDKPHRCPGERGGGMRFAREVQCDHGKIHRGSLGFGRCDTCNVITWPYAIRWTSPKWWRSEVWMWKLRYENWQRRRRMDG